MKHLKQLDSLTGVSMKALSTAIGLPGSGRKDFLHGQLVKAFTEATPLPANARVLSVDMGLRNLAFTLLTMPKGGKTAAARPNKKPNLVSIHAWDRLSLIPPNILPEAEDPYSPQNMSRTAYTLIKDKFLPLKPTHVLIERQRFRTRGQAAVQEWTVRVNMLESMLHAVLTSLRLTGHWKDGVVVPVNPRTIGSFYAREDEKIAKGAKRMQEIKKMKIATVAKWLKEEDPRLVLETEEVRNMRSRFLDKFEGKRVPSKRWKKGENAEQQDKEEAKGDRLEKIDDLADSLLQGVVWLTWQENKNAMVEKGLNSVLENGVMNTMLVDRY